jgi:hypothetical protein
MNKENVRNNLRAVWHGLKFATSRHPAAAIRLFAVIALLMGAAIWGAIEWSKPPLTTEEIMVRDQERRRQEELARPQREFAKQQQEESRRRTEIKRQFCRLRSACPLFAKVRQECATAGNYKLCVNIKMGDDASLIEFCTNEGHVAYKPNNFPNAIDCFIFDYLPN